MKKKLTNNLGLKIGSLILAIVIWVLIQGVADPVTTRDFTVEVEILNEDVLEQDDKDYTYTVVSGDIATFTVSGKTSILSDLSSSDFNVYADMSKLSVVNSVPVEITPKAYVDSSIEVEAHSNTLEIELDELITIQKDVTVSTTGNPEDGYAVGATTCDTNLVTISGPKNLLESVDKLVATVDVSGQSSDFEETVDPVLYDSDGEEISADNIDMELEDGVTVSVEIWETVILNVDLNFDAVTTADGYMVTDTAYSPSQITVTADEETLAENEIVQEGSVTYEILDEKDLTETTEGVFYIADYLGDDLKVVDSDVRESGITYQIDVEQTVSAAWPVEFKDVVLKGSDADLTYELTSGEDTISFMVTGTSETLNSVRNDSSENVTFYLDVSDIEEAGTYDVSVTASLPDGIELVEDQTVSIQVSEAEETEGTKTKDTDTDEEDAESAEEE